ncbi:hypothetical protein M3Y99_01407300 [Aphelenchoides fujianensis]|nr:hypothetical protein M3Y99_01407300 [Aphelenchoides fujianensis]
MIGLWIFFLLLPTVHSLACYECSRGGDEQQQKLVDLFIYLDDDPSAQRALNHSSALCGSNVTLDRTFRAYCPLCQIVYLIHDPDLTAIASCGIYGPKSKVEGHELRDSHVLRRVVQ